MRNNETKRKYKQEKELMDSSTDFGAVGSLFPLSAHGHFYVS